MNDELLKNSNNLSINIIEQKENYSSIQKAKRIRKISIDLKKIEDEKAPKDNPEKKDFFPKITNQNSNNNENKDNNININNNDQKEKIPQKEEKSLKIVLDKKTSEEFKSKLDNIIKNEYEYNNVLPLIQKGSYLTGLPDSIYNKKTKSNAQSKKNYKEKETTKILRHLKEKENSLSKEISSVKNKKQKLLNISYGNTNSSPIEKNINNYEERRLQSIENNLLEKLDEVKNQIKDIIQREEALKKSKSSLIQNFIKKYENEENVEGLSKKYISLNNNTQRTIIKLKKDCIMKNLNRFKIKQDENQNEIEQKKLYLKEQNEREKEIIKNRKKKIDEQMSKIKEKVKTAENQPLETYLFYKMANDFNEKEKLFLKNIKLTKKTDIIGKEEIKQLQEKYNQKKKELEKKAQEKTQSMKKLWNSRSLILPKYKSPMLKLIQEDEKKRMEEEEEKQNKKDKFYENKKNYFKDIVPLPKINEKLRKEAIKKNFSMVNLHGKKRVNYIKEELKNINKIRKNSFDLNSKRFKQSNNLAKKYKYRITNINKSLDLKNKKSINGIDTNNDKINNSMDLANLNKKPKIKIPSPVKKIIKRNPKEINYLKEFENKTNKNYNWDKYIAEDEENKAISIQNVKSQVEALDDKAKRKQVLLKMKGGYSSNLKMGKDISNLLINSINGKLSIISAINEENV